VLQPWPTLYPLTPPCNLKSAARQRGVPWVCFEHGRRNGLYANAGKMLTRSMPLGVGPRRDTDVVFHHGHPDHLWGGAGMIRRPLFAMPATHIGQEEWAYWTDLTPSANHRFSARQSFAVGADAAKSLQKRNAVFYATGERSCPASGSR